MDTRDYPGKGLSLSQLVSALNEELKHAAFSPSFTLDDVSQLDQDISTALAATREWRNSFAPINRVPLDVLSIIPTLLPSQKDRFRATFVCRHWRRTFLQHGTLWSSLFLSNGEIYVKTLLERVKGSQLDVHASHRVPATAMTLLAPHAKQIKYLDFVYNYWVDIQRFSELNPGPFPLLRTLIINAIIGNSSDAWTPPSLPLFSNAVNLTEFRLHTWMSPFLSHFAFPNLTAFELSVTTDEGFHASQILDFLEASPLLRTVRILINAVASLEGIPQERVVVLPNVETISLVACDYMPCYTIASHVACPSAKHTSLMHEDRVDHVLPEEAFPTSVSWNAIAGQYGRSRAEEVTFEIKVTPNHAITCSLSFQSPDATIIELCFKVTTDRNQGWSRLRMSFARSYHDIFSQALGTIRDHPQLANIKRLHIRCHSSITLIPSSHLLPRIAGDVGRLFESMGPLEELSIYHCDLRPYLFPFLDLPGFDVEQPVVFPPTKKFTVSYPLSVSPDDFVAALVGLVKSQHTLGVPFEHVAVRMVDLPAAMVEGLNPWVDTAEYYHARHVGDDDFGSI